VLSDVSSSSPSSSPSLEPTSVIVLGDLHLPQEDISSFESAREDVKTIVQSVPLSKPQQQVAFLEEKFAKDLSVEELKYILKTKLEASPTLVSLGDLGRKQIKNEPGDAGTTKCFVDGKAYLDSFDLPYSIVLGNHDLEGLCEFDSDAGNIDAFKRVFGLRDDQATFWTKTLPNKVLLIGLSTERFRSASHSSHEVFISQEQRSWFKRELRAHPREDGWRTIVFSHAPILGSGLTVLQDVHLKNGCAYLNHSGDKETARFFYSSITDSSVCAWFR